MSEEQGVFYYCWWFKVPFFYLHFAIITSDYVHTAINSEAESKSVPLVFALALPSAEDS